MLDLSDSMLNGMLIVRDVVHWGCWICLTVCCTLGMLDLSDSMLNCVLVVGGVGSV